MKLVFSYYLHLLRRHLRLILLTTFLFAVIFLFWALLKKPVYMSKAVVLPPSVQDMNLSLVSSILPQSGLNPANATLALLRSRTLKEALVEEFRLDTLYGLDRMEDVLKKLNKRYKVRYLRLDGIILIEAYDENPELAKKMADFAIDYVEKMNEKLQIFVRKPLLKVVDYPRIPEKKAKPKRAFIVLTGLFLGVLLGATISLAKELPTPKVQSPDELDEIGLPLYGKVHLKKGRVWLSPELVFILSGEDKPHLISIVSLDGTTSSLENTLVKALEEVDTGYHKVEGAPGEEKEDGAYCRLAFLQFPFDGSSLKLLFDSSFVLVVVYGGRTKLEELVAFIRGLSNGKKVGGIFVEG